MKLFSFQQMNDRFKNRRENEKKENNCSDKKHQEGQFLI